MGRGRACTNNDAAAAAAEEFLTLFSQRWANSSHKPSTTLESKSLARRPFLALTTFCDPPSPDEDPPANPVNVMNEWHSSCAITAPHWVRGRQLTTLIPFTDNTVSVTVVVVRISCRCLTPAPAAFFASVSTSVRVMRKEARRVGPSRIFKGPSPPTLSTPPPLPLCPSSPLCSSLLLALLLLALLLALLLPGLLALLFPPLLLLPPLERAPLLPLSALLLGVCSWSSSDTTAVSVRTCLLLLWFADLCVDLCLSSSLVGGSTKDFSRSLVFLNSVELKVTPSGEAFLQNPRTCFRSSCKPTRSTERFAITAQSCRCCSSVLVSHFPKQTSPWLDSTSFTSSSRARTWP
mmetsp:Transcript_64277/g.129209  ORF Transcript_64277/g.129209 Transcript_64277/m.129209 type:complete len:349 (-) Transcript_64277:1361-2407(-)